MIFLFLSIRLKSSSSTYFLTTKMEWLYFFYVRVGASQSDSFIIIFNCLIAIRSLDKNFILNKRYKSCIEFKPLISGKFKKGEKRWEIIKNGEKFGVVKIGYNVKKRKKLKLEKGKGDKKTAIKRIL